mgnify:CR=1 FL=1
MHIPLLRLLSMAVLLCCVSQSAWCGQTAYHRATSEPEKTLDSILRNSEKDHNLIEFVLHTPFYKSKNDKGYAQYFTRTFLATMAAMEKKTIQENCKGKYIEGELCGTDYNPVNCALDNGPSPYLFKVDSLTQDKAIIAYKWRTKDATPAATYELLREGGAWKIDRVICHP